MSVTPNPNPSPELIEISEDDLRESIRKTLEQPDMTQNLFARMQGISRGHLSEFLSGKRRAEPAIAGPCGYRWALVEDTRATDDLTDAALSPQTLPAPGEVDHIADAGNMFEVERIRRAIWGYVNAQPEDAAMLPLVQFLANRDVFLAEAIALATVAAANDEGVARNWFPHLCWAGEPMHEGQFREPWPMDEERSALLEVVERNWNAGPDALVDAAIRLLSQGGGKA